MRAAKYRRNGWWTIKVPHPAGGVRALAARTRDSRLADKIVAMCDTLMERPTDHWALVGICDGAFKLRVLYAHYVNQTLEQLRADTTDLDLASTLAQWRDLLIVQFGEPTASAHTVNQYTRQVAHFFTFCQSTKRSALSAPNAAAWIASVKGETGTRARYWAALKAFVLHLQSVGILTESPIAKLSAPPLGEPRDRHLEHAEMLRLIDAAEGAHRTAEVLAHIGMELGAVRRVRACDVDLAAHTVFAHGTKRKKGRKNYRSRRCHVPKWARGYLHDAIAELAPNALLVPFADITIQQAHVALCDRLEIPDYRFHDARHTYAVAMVKAGTPSRVVGKQLGHKDGQQVERVYGNYAPTMQELEYWAEREHALREEKQPQLQKQLQSAFSPSIAVQDVCPPLPEKEANKGQRRAVSRIARSRAQRWSSTNSLTFYVGPRAAVVTR